MRIVFENFTLQVLGIAIAGIGVMIKLKLLNYNAFLGESITKFLCQINVFCWYLIGIQFAEGFVSYFPYVLIAIGCVVLLIAFLGCCGSITENRCMLLSVSAFYRWNIIKSSYWLHWVCFLFYFIVYSF